MTIKGRQKYVQLYHAYHVMLLQFEKLEGSLASILVMVV